MSDRSKKPKALPKLSAAQSTKTRITKPIHYLLKPIERRPPYADSRRIRSDKVLVEATSS